MPIHVWGTGLVADRLRLGCAADDDSCDAHVFVVDIDPLPRATQFISDDDIDRLWERPLRQLISAVVEAKSVGARRIIVVIPTIALSGGASYAVQSATAEAAHVFVKSAARQWGRDGVIVNCVAVAPQEFGIDVAVAGEVSLAPRALAEIPSFVDVVRSMGDQHSPELTGQTIVVDGGLWM